MAAVESISDSSSQFCVVGSRCSQSSVISTEIERFSRSGSTSFEDVGEPFDCRSGKRKSYELRLRIGSYWASPKDGKPPSSNGGGDEAGEDLAFERGVGQPPLAAIARAGTGANADSLD